MSFQVKIKGVIESKDRGRFLASQEIILMVDLGNEKLFICCSVHQKYCHFCLAERAALEGDWLLRAMIIFFLLLVIVVNWQNFCLDEADVLAMVLICKTHHNDFF